ncbi:two-component response regulator-like APRR2 isoform X2 [Punica granatum]|uniref:Two-component response regulator-like APRR2 isoform X2 n=1 Tax=Punica granatum TaxID=22663 RepID=A0A6P8DNA5_PUNGR|nr:two-component response regulator-like APRR2 isoform X2 [Punica granatum]
MVCTANDLQGWKDFPKGLRVLLLDRDSTSAAELKAKLEAMDYTVSIFCDENEALSAVANKCETFHVAIVEVSSSNSSESFKFLETARDLPTIMVSDVHCLNTTMKCIALGAVEFLHKPLCENKLRNIWQHVVHKLPIENGEVKKAASADTENVSVHEPSTPQLKRGAPFIDDGDCLQEQTHCSTEKGNGEQDVESKSVETTCNNLTAKIDRTEHRSVKEASVKVEDESGDNNSKSESSISPLAQAKDDSHGSHDCANNTAKSSCLQTSAGKVNRKKLKVDWTSELHKKFVQAVEQLGVDQAIPSRILELMKVQGLTRHNVASHLQKYRMNRRHILPKEDDRRWPQHRDMVPRSYYPHRPIMAFPPYHSNHLAYPVWGVQGNHQPGMQFWGPPSYPPWQPAENWQWKPYPGLHADAWGCPVMPPAQGPGFPFPQDGSGYHCAGAVHNVPQQSSFELHQAEEVVDKAVKEAINKPWLPLPLGLKPPSTEGVLAELSRQGIPCIPPRLNGTEQH